MTPPDASLSQLLTLVEQAVNSHGVKVNCGCAMCQLRSLLPDAKLAAQQHAEALRDATVDIPAGTDHRCVDAMSATADWLDPKEEA